MTWQVSLKCDAPGCDEQVANTDLWYQTVADYVRDRAVRYGWRRVGGAWRCPRHVHHD